MKAIIYQMLPRLWGDGKLSSVDDATLSYLRELGVSALWLTGIPRHASGKDFVKGDPGSPYAVSDYYDINPYLADDPGSRFDEFASLVARVHARGLRLIIDLVPNHVAPDYADTHGGIPLRDWHDFDWSDTVKIDYDNPRAAQALGDIVKFWASKGVDGFRCDMVELVPVQALEGIITTARRSYPGLFFIGEAYDKANYAPLLKAGFDYLYDKSGMYDSLRAIVRGEAPAGVLTGLWQELGPLQSRMLDFLENHDEVRFCSPDYAGDYRFERAPLAVAALLTGAPFMLYFGQEVGITASESDNCRTSIFNWSSPAELRVLWGYVHGAPLPFPEEARCMEMFREILSMARRLCDTPMFDLCYCQERDKSAPDSFDPRFHFAFLRGRTLFFCNFGPEDARFDLVIPAAARELNGVKESPVTINCRAFDIMVEELPTSRESS